MSRTDRERGRLRAVVVAAALTLAGIVVAELFTLPVILQVPEFFDAPGDVSRATVLAFLGLQFAGMAAVGGAYLVLTGRSWDWLDLPVPTGETVRHLGLAAVAALAFVVAINVVVSLLELPVAPNVLYDVIGDDATLALLLIGVVLLLNAPVEEFLFRNVVQKRLYVAFSRRGAVLLTSGLFALVHVPTYSVLVESRLAVVVSLSVIFLAAAFFGAVYARTGHLLVPIVAHATFNGVQLAVLFVHLQFGVPPEVPTTGLAL